MFREVAKKGIRVVFAASRRPASVQQITTSIGIINQSVICTDGALIMSYPYGEIWQSLTIPNRVGEALRKYPL